MRRILAYYRGKALKANSGRYFDGKLIATYKSLSDASEASGVNIATIIRQCKGKCVKARKYKFEYV